MVASLKKTYIVKIYRNGFPDDYRYGWFGCSHKYPHTYIRAAIKGKYRWYLQNTETRRYLPYFKYGDDVLVQTEIIEIMDYCPNHKLMHKKLDTMNNELVERLSK